MAGTFEPPGSDALGAHPRRARVVQVFDALGIPYVVGGSLASSVYGIPRATQDVDLVADLKVPDAEQIAQLLSGEFYVDADMIRDAILRRASFNVIHLATMFKADIFVMKRDAWFREEMSRARKSNSMGPTVPSLCALPVPKTLCFISSFGSDLETRSLTVSGPTSLAPSRSRAPLLDVADLLSRARSQQ